MNLMMSRAAVWARLATFALLTAALAPLGCATGAGGSGAAPRRDFKAADYYPLMSGWKWAYDVEKDGMNILAIYSVLERTGETAIVQTGVEQLTYAVTGDGVAQRDDGGIGDYVIRNPVVLGAEWPVAGGKAKIVSVDKDVSLEPAGRFAGCVVVEVTRTDPVRVVRTTYAPEVGPVAVEVEVQDGSRFVTATRAHLRAVTRPGQMP
jgi:hypothetical protein